MVTGRIIDSETKKPIAAAKVSINEKNISTISNAGGFFQLTIDSLALLTVSLKDYETLTFIPPAVNNFQVEIKKRPIEIFKEGMPEFYKFISQNISYPSSARSTNKSGYVYVSFQIDSTGNLINSNVIKDIGGGCGKELIRVLNRASKKFIPDTSHDTYILPVQFRLSSDNKEHSRLTELPEGKLLSEIVVVGYTTVVIRKVN
jgi:TonB family protein